MCHFVEPQSPELLFFKKTKNPNNIIISISASSNKILPTQRIQHVPIYNGKPPRDVEKIIRDIALIKGVVSEIVFSPKEISLIKNKKNNWRSIKKRLRFLLENYIPD